MGCARYHLHVDCHGSPVAVGHAQLFEQATHGTVRRHRPLLAVNDYFDHHKRLLTKKAAARGMRLSLPPYRPRGGTAPVARRYKVKGASLRWHYPGQVLRVVTFVSIRAPLQQRGKHTVTLSITHP